MRIHDFVSLLCVQSGPFQVEAIKKLNELLTSVCCPQKQTGKYKHDLEAKLIIPAQRKHSLEGNHNRDLGYVNQFKKHRLDPKF